MGAVVQFGGFKTNNNVVWCPKYRRPVLAGGVDARLKELVHEVTRVNRSRGH
jgi:REP element-mobilizing transposase RayT